MQEIRFAARRLLKNPLQLAAGVLAFSLGIGMNTAMFSIGDALLYRPVDLPELVRLVVFEASSRGNQLGIYDTAPADFLEFQSKLQSFERIALAALWDVNITRDGEPEQAGGARVSRNWFETTGSQFVLGKGFGDSREDRVVVISQGLWARRFGGAPDILGRKIVLNQEEYEIAGVIKETSRFPSQAQIYRPLDFPPALAQNRQEFDYLAAGRLRPGVMPSAAQAELNLAFQNIAVRYPDTHKGRSVDLVPLARRVTGTNDIGAQFVAMLTFASGFVLLIACANVANLQLARVSARAREFAIANALGSSRWRVARGVLIESCLLALAGAVPGVILASWCVEGFKQLLPSEMWQYAPMWPYVTVSRTALWITAGLSVLAGILSGVWPAWSSTRSDAQEVLREGGRALTAGRGRQWFRGAMAAAQMMLALVLLIGSGLLVRGSRTLLNVFDSKQPENIATMQTTLAGTQYPDRARRTAFLRKLEEGVRNIPGQTQFAFANYIPLSDDGSSFPIVAEGRPEPKPAERQRVQNMTVSDGYHAIMRIPVLQGRGFNASDAESSEPVCLADEMLAAALFPGENPLGRRVAPAVDQERNYCRIVGVVGRERHMAWENSFRPTLYRPILQVPGRAVTMLVRANEPAAPLLTPLKQAVFAADPAQPVHHVLTYKALIEVTLSGMWMVTAMMTGLGAVALVLACVGLYSVMSHSVEERTSEIGMRVAMGARPLDILSLLGRNALAMCGGGMVLGLAIGYGLAQLFSSMLFGVNARDFWALSAVALPLAASGALAVYLPMRRALRMDPAEALRHD
jgi:putative ABC transport system permease protein